MKDKLNPVCSFLCTQTTLVLATISEDGTSHSAPLFFISDDRPNLYWFSSRSSLHSSNCLQRPEASVSISTNARTWQQIQGLQMRGCVSVVTDRAIRKSLTARYIEHFGLGNLFSIAIRRSALYCFTPRWLRYLDNTRRFGYKFELTLPQSDKSHKEI